MENESSFLWETADGKPTEVNIDNNGGFHDDVEDLFKELHGISVEELEVELRRKEKELYLCSRLGLFLAQEVDELMTQRRGIISDHTKLLIELQEYKDTRRSYLDISDGASEHNPAAGKVPNHLPNQEDNEFTGQAGELSATNLDSTALERTYSVESLDLVSNAESTLTSASSVRDLHHDLNIVQKSHDRITKLEVLLDKTRAKYRSLMTNYAHKLKELSRELGSCVMKARPYFEAVKKAKKCQLDTQQAAMEYKRAVNMQKAARDMVKLTEERVMAAEDKLDPALQEMLNQANVKVNEASQEKSRIHRVHMKAAKLFQVAEEKKTALQQTLQRNIAKSRPYFEVQREFQEKLEAITKKLNMLELKLMEARQSYSINLSRLRRSDTSGKTSDALQSLSERGMGVGAENPLGLLNTSSVLHKPALDFLEREASDLPDGASKSNSDEAVSDIPAPVRTRLHYNPYDLLYLTDLGSDSPSNLDSDDDEYLQDF